MAIRIALVEDNPSLRKRFIDNFKYFQSIDLVLVSPTGEDFLNKMEQATAQELPQVVLMDIELPGIDGIETTARLKQSLPDIEVMMLTVFEQPDKIFNSLKAGAVGYMLKDESPSNIVKAVEELLEGGAPMSRTIARKMIGLISSDPNLSEDSKLKDQAIQEYGLSEQEVKIIQRLVDGNNYLEIAEGLFISPHTVKTHIKNIYKKLHVHSRASAVKLAIDKKIVGIVALILAAAATLLST
ncbi:response regulator transcription factor [Imperialibacter roseus]|uniref:Response regulator transcription factor n=1 Tax=Imperialibacter roseus TaxID=1324217 RepID=A0ABZ0IMP2_9BACT|nr:response regulator transcription factor [Imperialibacter roseus]WOK05739.1 response regulator transcription factor [Imperialibacter roseus]